MMTTKAEAFEAMLAHHAGLMAGVTQRVSALSAKVEAGASYEPSVGDLVAYLAAEVLPHAMGEEHTIYQVAASREGLAETVAGMVDEHRRLAASVERLATVGDALSAVSEAEAISSLFDAHVAKENDLVLPPLAADDTVDLAALLHQMHRLTETAREESTTDEKLRTPDTESKLLALVLEGAGELVEAGRGDRACRLTASAWAALRAPRPDLAVRARAALHRLVRSVASEPVRFSAGVAGSRLEDVLDVRALTPGQRHERIFATYDALQPGDAFLLVNDHDPKPLRYQLEAEHPGAFTWDYLESGPQTWRVRIGRVPADSSR